MFNLQLAVGIADAAIAAERDFYPTDVQGIAAELAAANPETNASQEEIADILQSEIEQSLF